MKIGRKNRFIAFNKTASSLYSLIADGNYRSTSLGRNRWKALIGSQASLQTNCNREGFNVVSDSGDDWPRARIGIVGNNQNDCYTCDSGIGFGTGGYPDNVTTCGNGANDKYTAEGANIKAMGYILVQWDQELIKNGDRIFSGLLSVNKPPLEYDGRAHLGPTSYKLKKIPL